MASQSATLISVKGTLMVSNVLLTYQLRSKTKIQAGQFTAYHLTMPYNTSNNDTMVEHWRHCCRGILLSLAHQMSGCSACLIQFIWQHWRYFNVRLMNSIFNLIEFICLAFEGNQCGQR